MTPALKRCQSAKISFQVHEYVHDASTESYGMEAAEKLSVAVDRVFKTLVVKLNTGELVVCVIPVSSMLDLKLLANVANAKKAEMAEQSVVQRSTGYVIGGVSPIGQKRKLRTFLDTSAEPFSTIFISGGRRGLEIELAPMDLINITRGNTAALCRSK